MTTITKLVRWNRRRQFIKAYRILRNNANRHLNAGHEMDFDAVNEAHLHMQCHFCPELQP